MNGFVENLLETAISNALVAGALAVVAFSVSRLLRSPPLAHCLWLLVLLKLVTPPVVRVDVPAPLATHTVPTHTVPAQTVPAPAPGIDFFRVEPVVGREEGPEGAAPRFELAEIPPPPIDTGSPPAVPPSRPAPSPADVEAEASIALVHFFRWCFWAWLAGSLVWLSVALVRVARFHRLVGRAPEAPGALRLEVERLARRFGLRRTPRVAVAGWRFSPLVWFAGGHAVLVLPGRLLETLSARQRQTLIAHELAHLRRHDHWLRWFEFVVLALSWWNPVAWWARRELQEAEEHCCDAWVQWAFPDDHREYARALLRTVDFLAEAPAAPGVASGLGQAYLLKRRFQMILRETIHRQLSWAPRLVVLIAAVAVLPWAPALSDAQEARDDVRETGEANAQPAPGDARDRAGASDAATPDDLRDLADDALLRGGVVSDLFAGSEASRSRDVEKRLGALEKKFDLLLRELRSLRNLPRTSAGSRASRPWESWIDKPTSRRTWSESRRPGPRPVPSRGSTPFPITPPVPVATDTPPHVVSDNPAGEKKPTLRIGPNFLEAYDFASGEKIWRLETGTKGLSEADVAVEGRNWVVVRDPASQKRIWVDLETGIVSRPLPTTDQRLTELRNEKKKLRRRLQEIEAEEKKLREGERKENLDGLDTDDEESRPK